MFKTFITIFLLFQATKCLEINMDFTINDQLSKLAHQIIRNYFDKNKCIIIIKEDNLLTDFPRGHNAFMQILTEDLCFDELAKSNILQAFSQNCYGYIIQISNPECFMKIWTEMLYLSIQRPNPKIFYLPVVKNETTNISHDIYSMRETEISDKILVAEYSADPKWPISLYTNNFFDPVGKPGRVESIFLDRWNFETGFENFTDLYPDKIQNLRGKSVRLMAFNYVPYAHKDPYDGFEIELFKLFCMKYNCTLEFIDDGFFWGSIYKNGTGNGINGLVYTDKSDFGVAAYFLWMEEFMYIDYSHSYLRGAVTLLVPKPIPLSGWKVPFLPFDIKMWCTYVLTIIVATIFMYLITSATMKYTRFKEAIIRKKQFIAIEDSLLRIIGMSVLQQPSIPLVPHTPIRHLFTSLEMFYFILTTCYCAKLSSYLTVPLFTKPIDTFHELAAQNFPWAAYHEAFVYALQFADDPEVKTVVNNFHKMDMEGLKEAARSGKYGLTLERCPSGHYSEHEHITLEVIDNSHIMAENLFGSPVVAVIRKASPYKEKLDKFISLALDGGLFKAWEVKAALLYLNSRKQLAIELSRSLTRKSEPKKLTLNHIQGTFIIYGSGVIISFMILICECVYGKRERLNH
ncbi:uncharacterized protein LOC106662468 isoform X1 [Cimex lectularius]|uniref:Ionotropic glutamate receptor C-terminal domain-containing protein n=1 Tax=Cimex lectularius TaxID=79782 RepID=A0A8I6SSH3_CIMLE|nr:uncharacterized protein LOC106662468 isoform X1 [Cimex lectularius]